MDILLFLFALILVWLKWSMIVGVIWIGGYFLCQAINKGDTKSD